VGEIFVILTSLDVTFSIRYS